MNHEFPSLFVMVSVRANGTTGNRDSPSQKVVILNAVKDLLFFAPKMGAPSFAVQRVGEQ
jgi:hypothetical protein